MNFVRKSGRLRIAGDVAVVLLISFFITFLGIIALSFSLLLFPISEEMVDIGILMLYVLSCFVAGKIIGKRRLVKRYLWGILIGTVYYWILLFLSIGCDSSVSVSVKDVITSMLICQGSATLGGMLS